MKTVGNRLKQVRTQNDLTQMAGASRLGIADRTYKNYETDQRVIPLNTAVEFANMFSLDMNWLADSDYDRANTFEKFAKMFVGFSEARDAYTAFEKRNVSQSDATKEERQNIRTAGEKLEKIGGTLVMSAAIRSFFPDDAARTLRAGDELNHLWSGIGGWMA